MSFFHIARGNENRKSRRFRLPFRIQAKVVHWRCRNARSLKTALLELQDIKPQFSSSVHLTAWISPIRVMQAFCFRKSQEDSLYFSINKLHREKKFNSRPLLSRKITQILNSLWVFCKLKFTYILYLYATLFFIAVLSIFIVIVYVFLSTSFYRKGITSWLKLNFFHKDVLMKMCAF